MAYATFEQCEIIVDSIGDLIPDGRNSFGQNWHAVVDFNSHIPRAWRASLREENALPALDPRKKVAEFETYGLNAYGADPDHKWDIVGWKALKTEADETLAVFADDPLFTRTMRMQYAVDLGHFVLDTTEQEALIEDETLTGLSIPREAQARLSSFRLTEEGATYLLSVLEATRLEASFK